MHIKLCGIVFVVFNIIFCCTVNVLQAQQISEKTLSKIESNASKYEDLLDKKTEKYLRKLEKQERKFAKKLAKVDSSAAKKLLNSTTEKYNGLRDKIANKTEIVKQKVTQYLPNLDSTSTALKFITNNPLVKQTKEYTDKAKATLGKYEELQQKLQSAADVKKLIKERKEELKQLAGKYNLTKYLGKYNKQAYYYQAQINEYREALKDPIKAEQLLVKTLAKVPAFKDFFAHFSQMGQLFPQQGTSQGMASLAGLQTRTQVQGQLQALGATLPTSGPNTSGMQVLRQNMQQAQTQLSNLRNRVNQAGGSSSDFDLPEFTPNTQKTKSLLKRFELKTDLQTTKGSTYFPNMADLSLGLGYKLSDNKQIGVQAAYKLGLGNGFNNIKLSTEGLGLRSFADFKFKKKANLWLTAGYERNYLTALNSPLSPWRVAGANAWTEAAVAGLSKKYKIGKKKGGEMKILYNFLWRSQPNGQQFIYRTGINF